jgi:hypothetical protein
MCLTRGSNQEWLCCQGPAAIYHIDRKINSSQYFLLFIYPGGYGDTIAYMKITSVQIRSDVNNVTLILHHKISVVETASLSGISMHKLTTCSAKLFETSKFLKKPVMNTKRWIKRVKYLLLRIRPPDCVHGEADLWGALVSVSMLVFCDYGRWANWQGQQHGPQRCIWADKIIWKKFTLKIFPPLFSHYFQNFALVCDSNYLHHG